MFEWLGKADYRQWVMGMYNYIKFFSQNTDLVHVIPVTLDLEPLLVNIDKALAVNNAP